MRRLLLRSTALLAALACAPLAFAAAPPASSAAPGTSAAPMQHHGWMHHDQGRRMHRGHMGMFRQLDLTDTQRTEIKQIRKEQWAQGRTSMQALRERRMAYAHATPGTAAYQTAVDNLAQAESTAAHARVVNEAARRAKIYNVLTPAQRTKLASLQTERQARMQKWRAEHMHHEAKPGTSAASTP